MRESESSARARSLGRVLVADDTQSVAHFVVRVLRQAGYECATCAGAGEVMAALERRGADVVLADLAANPKLPEEIRARYPEAALIVLTVTPGIGSAQAAMRRGAFDYLVKPLDEDELCTVVGRAIEIGRLRREADQLRQRLEMAEAVSSFVAESPAAKQLLALVRRAAATDSTILIEGETGTGKGIVARMLHYWSEISEGPFVAVSCRGAVVAGAASEPARSTAAAADSLPFERARGGTLFIDDIAEASPSIQAELVRVLDEAEAKTASKAQTREPGARLVVASAQPLKAEMEAGRFRSDLYFRLSTLPIRIPPLRERREDIAILARRFLAQHAARTGRRLSLTSEAEREMLAYPWPGNVRELRNVLERAAMLTGADFLPSKSLDLGSRSDPRSERATSEAARGDSDVRTETAAVASGVNSVTPAPQPERAAEAARPASSFQPDGGAAEAAETGTLQECLDQAARTRIKAALEAAGGNRTEAARALNVDGATLSRLIKRLGL